MRRGSVVEISKADGEKRPHTQLSEDVPEPVENEHRVDAVDVGWTGRMNEVCWSMSCPLSAHRHVEPPSAIQPPRSQKKIE